MNNMLFIEDQNFNRLIELQNATIHNNKHPYWKLLWRFCINRGLRFEYFV